MKKLLNRVVIKFSYGTANRNEVSLKPLFSKKNISDDKVAVVGIFWGNIKELLNSQIIFLN